MSSGRYRGSDDFDKHTNPFVEVVQTGRHSQPGRGPAQQPPRPLGMNTPARSAAPGRAVVERQEARTHAGTDHYERHTGVQRSAPPLEAELERRLGAVDVLYATLTTTSYYELLGVDESASEGEVREAFSVLSRRFHPDAFATMHLGPRQAKVDAVFAALTIAHDTLSSSERRAVYDRAQQAAAARPSAQPARSRTTSPSLRAARTSTGPRASDRPQKAATSAAPRRVYHENSMSSRAYSPSPTPRSVPANAPPAPAESFGGDTRTFGVVAPTRATSARLNHPSLEPGPFGTATQTYGTVSGSAPPARPSGATSVASAPPARPSGAPSAASAPPANHPCVPPASAKTGFEDERRSALLRDLDQAMQQRLRQSAPPNSGMRERGSALAAGPSAAPAADAKASTFGAAPPTASAPAPRPSVPEALHSAPPTGLLSAPAGPVGLSLLELAEQLRGPGGLRNWAAQRLREAYHEEQAGHVVDAANIVRIVLQQLKDPNIEAQCKRLQALVAQKTAPAHKTRARAAEHDGRWQDAAECWQKVRDAQPNDPQTHFYLARALLRAGDIKGAGRAATRASELAPEHVETREILIEFFERMGMKLNAKRERDTVQKLLEARPPAGASAAAKKK